MCTINDFNTTLFSGKCDFIKQNNACHFEDGFVQYIEIIYCGFPLHLLPLAICLLILWLFMLLIGLATTADGFFGPCLIVMAQTLKLSQNLAGVTLLALGNGAPDIFSALSAITQLSDGDAGLAFGGLLGAGLFVTSVTAGAISIVQPFDSMRRPVIKDMIFYLFAVFWAFVILMKNEMTVYESAGFIGVYVTYVIITVVSRGVFAHTIDAPNVNADSKEEDSVKPEIGLAVLESLPRDEMDSSMPSSRRFQELDYINKAFEDDQLQPNCGKAKLSFISERTESSDTQTGIDAELLRRHLSHLKEESDSIYYEESGPIRNSSNVPSQEPRHRSYRQSENKKMSYSSETAQERLSRMEERNKRVSRTSQHQQHHKLSSSSSLADDLKKTSNAESSRKLSQNVMGFEAKANYLTRWLITYGGADELERKLSTGSVVQVKKKSTSKAEEKTRSTSTNSHIALKAERKGSNLVLQNNLRGPFVVQKVNGSPLSTQKRLSTQSKPKVSEVDIEDRNKRISRVQLHSATHSPNLSFSNGVSSPGVDRKVGYMARYIIAHGDSSHQIQHNNPKVPQGKSNPKTFRRSSSVVYDDILDMGFTVSVPSSSRSSTISNAMIECKDACSEKSDSNEESEEDIQLNPFLEFFYSICPIDTLEWNEMSFGNKIYEIIKSPIMFIIQLTTAVVDYDRPMNGWSRILNSFHCISAPLFWMFAFKLYTITITENFPLWALLLSIGSFMAFVVFFTSEHWQPPRYHAFFAFYGFLTAIVWIYTLANEVVNILETLGLTFNISTAFLGVTLLAWANSIGDVVSNVVLARQGFPRIAISACFGGPLFNLLLGFGIPFLIKTIQMNGKISLNVSLLQVMLTSFLLLGLLISLIAFPLMKFHIRKSYGAILISFYMIFFVLAILTEVKVLPQFHI